MLYDPSASEAERKKELSSRLQALSSTQEEKLAQQNADQLGLPYMSLTVFPIDQDTLEIVPKDIAQKASTVLFYRKGKDVRLASVQPNGQGVDEIVKSLAKQFGVEPSMYVISRRSLSTALARYRKEHAEERPLEGELRAGAKEAASAQKTIASLEELGARITTLPPSEILQSIMVHAVHMNASDVHIEPREKEAQLRFRIDGVLQDITAFARDGWALVLSRTKVLAGLKLNVHEVPQDGSFVFKIEDETYDIRVSVLPGGWGENIVMRLLNRRSQAVAVTDLGMKKRDFEVVQRELKRANGMILVTGPTGSGKTTTLASFINEVNKPGIKIITLEDPIEYRLKGVEQTEIDASAGYTFAKGLRSILRQDPDMILVGEMRDSETAEVAIHAALTGHLVFTTLHTNDAAGAIPRLVNMGAKPFVLAPALNMIIAQRLVRVVCKKCAETYTPDLKTREHIEETMRGVRPDIFNLEVLSDKNLTFMRAKGCGDCVGGYKGRIGVFEIFTVERNIEELVLAEGDELRIQDAALKQGMTTITQDAYLKVIEGITTVEEVERISQE